MQETIAELKTSRRLRARGKPANCFGPTAIWACAKNGEPLGGHPGAASGQCVTVGSLVVHSHPWLVTGLCPLVAAFSVRSITPFMALAHIYQLCVGNRQRVYRYSASAHFFPRLLGHAQTLLMRCWAMRVSAISCHAFDQLQSSLFLPSGHIGPRHWTPRLCVELHAGSDISGHTHRCCISVTAACRASLSGRVASSALKI